MMPRAPTIAILWLFASRCASRCEAFSVVQTRQQQSPEHSCPISTTTTTTTTLSSSLLNTFLPDETEQTLATARAYVKDKLQPRVDRINALEATIEDLGDEELQAKTTKYRKLLQSGEQKLDDIVEEAFAVVREAAWRVLELRHYDVQLLGGLALHDGRLAEMATGEGKTLVATLPTYVNALQQQSLVVTVNDYLARRDFEKMGQVHRFLGLTVGLVQSSSTTTERQAAYQCNVVYVTNSELGFDYLRDHLAVDTAATVSPPNLSQAYCLVDEADSVLIDEARTPLIVSEQIPAPAEKYTVATQIANALKPNVHYTVDLKNKNCILTEVGYKESEDALGIDSLFAILPDGTAWAPYVANAVKAKELFTKDIEYTVLKDDNDKAIGVGIIDSFTGRVLDGRRWSDGLHQSIEAREGIDVSQQSKVIAKVTYQALFRQFDKLAGMTGTAMADAKELAEVYGLSTVPIPTELPIARRDYPDVAFKTRKAANDALVREVVNVGGGDLEGRPCLIGTTSVAQSEELVEALEKKGIKAELLNASPKNAPRESEIIAQAGRAGVVTVATNMAGRGTDILLGGCATTMARIKTRSVLLQDGVLSDEQKSSLPSSPDEDYYPAPLDSETLQLVKASAQSLKAKGGNLSALEFDEILTIAFDTTEDEEDEDYIVQLRDAADAVKELYAEVLSAEKDAVKDRGGLYVMGTNRHESSRIDQQLRGRSGRQGDPGSSRFFLSFEDDMFVIFGGDSLQSILKTFRVSDDMPVEAPQVSDALDKVQGAVEEKYRDIRREIFNFDEVLNSQRKVIYKRREDVLYSSAEEALNTMKQYNEETVADLVKGQTDADNSVNTSKLLEKVTQFFPPVSDVLREDDIKGKEADTVRTILSVSVDEVFATKAEQVDKTTMAAGGEAFSLGRSSRYIALVTMDNAWSDHLQALENLKESVLLRKYQGRDPVTEYQNEAFTLFKGLENTMRLNAVFSLWQTLA